MDYLLCGNLPYPAWKKHISVQNLSNRRIRRYLVCRLKRPEARGFSHVRFTYLPVIVFYIKCFVSYFTFARTNAKSNEYLTRLRHPEFRTYWGHKILLAALDFTTKGTFYLIALFIWIFPGSQDLLLNILIL